MSGERAPEYKQAAAGAPPGRHGVTAPRPRAAAPPRGYGAPPGHDPTQLHFAQPQYVAPTHFAAAPRPAQPRPQPQYAPAVGAYPQQQQQQPPNVVYGIPPPPPAVLYQQQPQPAVYQQQPQQAVYQQQPVGAPPMQPLGQWTTGLFDCGEDPNNCVITFFLPCITFGQVAEVVDNGTTSCLLAGSIWMTVLVCFGAPCFVSCLWRTKLRAKYNIPQDGVGDVCLHFWCESCALCQEYRELNNRGLNPSLGWEHHRQQQYAQMGAPQPVYMQK